MKIYAESADLSLKYPFTISRSSRIIAENVIVRLEHGQITGYGEAAPSNRYGETRGTAIKFLSALDLSEFEDPFQLEDILDYVNNLSGGDTSAKAAVDIALHDWVGKKLGVPMWKYFGLTKKTIPPTSYTIGIDDLDVIEKKINEASQFHVLKVKVGVSQERSIIETIRKITDKPLRVDANEGWKSKEAALDNILWLEEKGAELVEQPMPSANLDDVRWLRERIHIPIIADESVLNLWDIAKIYPAYDGINIKLMKCSGIREALKMIHAARALDMKIMLGCMIESSVAISAAAQLSPLVDYADLDGNLLITNDPFSGLSLVNGRVMPSDDYGLGVKMEEEL